MRTVRAAFRSCFEDSLTELLTSLDTVFCLFLLEFIDAIRHNMILNKTSITFMQRMFTSNNAFHQFECCVSQVEVLTKPKAMSDIGLHVLIIS